MGVNRSGLRLYKFLLGTVTIILRLCGLKIKLWGMVQEVICKWDIGQGHWGYRSSYNGRYPEGNLDLLRQ